MDGCVTTQKRYIKTVYIMSDIKTDKMENYKNSITKCIFENCRLTENNNCTTIVASPSKQNPDYWYEWVRDSAIVMNYLADVLENKNTSENLKSDIIDRFKSYVSNHMKFQDTCMKGKRFYTDSEHKHSFMITLGEPKFNVDLSVFAKDWGRPQNDGPALRAMAVIKFANYLIKTSPDESTISYVKKYLYDSKWPDTTSLIKRDLQYVSHVWFHKCFDLWEEIEGHHFYTLMVQMKSLTDGAKLAFSLGDDHAGSFYKYVGHRIEHFISDRFYKNNKIVSSIDVINQNFTERYIDSSVMLAFIHTGISHNEQLLNTMADSVIMFKNEYKINQSIKNLMMIGRYINDQYYNGNPWVLTTASLSNILLTIDLNQMDKTKLSNDFFKLFGDNNEKCRENGKRIIEDLIKIEEFNKNILHSKLSFAEQINRETFEYLSADRLTWNYIELMRSLDLI